MSQTYPEAELTEFEAVTTSNQDGAVLLQQHKHAADHLVHAANQAGETCRRRLVIGTGWCTRNQRGQGVISLTFELDQEGEADEGLDEGGNIFWGERVDQRSDKRVDHHGVFVAVILYLGSLHQHVEQLHGELRIWHICMYEGKYRWCWKGGKSLINERDPMVWCDSTDQVQIGKCMEHIRVGLRVQLLILIYLWSCLLDISKYQTTHDDRETVRWQYRRYFFWHNNRFCVKPVISLYSPQRNIF